MEDKLQALTQKIYEEGVAKAREEAEGILAEAKSKADDLLAAAKHEAEKMRQQARQESEELRENVALEIRLSARQALSALKQEIAGLVTFQAHSPPLEAAMNDKDFLKKIIQTAVKNWGLNGQPNDGLALILPEEARGQLDQYLQSDIQAQLDNGLELRFSERLESGFRIGPADGSYVVSFSKKDFDNLFREYLRPKTVQLLFGNE